MMHRRSQEGQTKQQETDPYRKKKHKAPFSPDSTLMYYMTKAGWIIILNIVFLLSCIPLFTIGSAVTSFYYAMIKSIRRDRGYPLAEYWASFKRTFVSGSVATLVAGVWVALLVYLWNVAVVMSGTTGVFLQKIYIGLLIVTGAVVCYLFPVMSRFTMKLSSMVKLAFVMAVRFLPYTVVMLLGTLLIAFIWFRFLPVPLILVWPGAWCFVCTFMMEKVLRNYMPEPKEGEDAWYYE